LNVLRVQKYLDKSRMKELARDNMPFMGLDIHGLKEIDLTQVILGRAGQGRAGCSGTLE
jgi:hypothetical protein